MRNNKQNKYIRKLKNVINTAKWIKQKKVLENSKQAI